MGQGLPYHLYGELVRWLATAHSFPPGVLYRADRYDFNGAIDPSMSAEAVERRAKATVHYVASFEGLGLCERVARFL